MGGGGVFAIDIVEPLREQQLVNGVQPGSVVVRIVTVLDAGSGEVQCSREFMPQQLPAASRAAGAGPPPAQGPQRSKVRLAHTGARPRVWLINGGLRAQPWAPDTSGCTRSCTLTLEDRLGATCAFPRAGPHRMLGLPGWRPAMRWAPRDQLAQAGRPRGRLAGAARAGLAQRKRRAAASAAAAGLLRHRSPRAAQCTYAQPDQSPSQQTPGA